MNMALPAPSRDLVERFRRDLHAIADVSGGTLGVAVSGGPDSLALLLLAAAALPGRVEAATVDHGLRPSSSKEALFVARTCRSIGVPHVTLLLDWSRRQFNSVQAKAREARYNCLGEWAAGASIQYVATAHHLDDQAETMLLRLARGAGSSGLSGIRPVMKVAAGARVVRPLLTWRKQMLAGIVADSGLRAVDDPSNSDNRYDRTHARRLLEGTDWLLPERLAGSASMVADLDQGLAWAEEHLLVDRLREEAGKVALDAKDLPRELQRRLLVRVFERFDRPHVPGPKLMRLLERLQGEEPSTLAGVKATPGPLWWFEPAPPRRGR